MTEPSARVSKILQDALDLAAHPDTPEHEREQATATAQRLMEKYALSEAMLRAANRVTSGCLTEIMEFSGVFGVQHRDIAALIVFMNDGHPVIANEKRMTVKKNGKPGYDHVQVLYANLHATDVDRVKSLIASISLQSQNAMSEYDRRNPAKGHQKYLNRRTFLQAFMVGLRDRLEAAKAVARREAATEHAQQTGSTFGESQNAFALAIRQKDDELDKYMEQKYGKDGLRSSRRRGNKMGEAEAFASGHHAGKNAATGEASIPQARRAIS